MFSFAAGCLTCARRGGLENSGYTCRTGASGWMKGMDESDAIREIGEAAERGIPRFVVGIVREGTRGGYPRQPKSCGWLNKYPKQLGIYLILLGFTHGCGGSGPEAVADRFMEAYYAAANLGEAMQFADGLAAKKIQDQQLLLKGLTGAQSSPGRRVSFSRIEKVTMEGKLFFRYEVRIDVQSGGSFTRKSLLALAHGPNGWRVTNFSETD